MWKGKVCGVTRLLEQGKNVDVVYLDFGKAFDKLDFQITLQKLLKLGITGKLHKWIESFLTGRKQRVVVQQHLASVGAISRTHFCGANSRTAD